MGASASGANITKDWQDAATLRAAQTAAWERRCAVHARVVGHRRNGLSVLIRKIGGLRRMYADCKARGQWCAPGETWWRAQLPSLLRLIERTR